MRHARRCSPALLAAVMPRCCACRALARCEHQPAQCRQSSDMASASSTTPMPRPAPASAAVNMESFRIATQHRTSGRARGSSAWTPGRDRGVQRFLLGEQLLDVLSSADQAQEPRQQPARLSAGSAVLRIGVGVDELGRAILAPAGDRSRPCSGESVVLLHGRPIVQLSGAARFPVRWCEESRLTAHRAAFPTYIAWHSSSWCPLRKICLTARVA